MSLRRPRDWAAQTSGATSYLTREYFSSRLPGLSAMRTVRPASVLPLTFPEGRHERAFMVVGDNMIDRMCVEIQ